MDLTVRDCPNDEEDTMAIKVGDRLPEGTLLELGASGPAPVNVAEATKGKKIAIFGIVGAFTPT
jgi:cytochrome c peroxidase